MESEKPHAHIMLMQMYVNAEIEEFGE